MKIIKKFSQYVKENFEDGESFDLDQTSDPIDRFGSSESDVIDDETEMGDLYSNDLDNNPEGDIDNDDIEDVVNLDALKDEDDSEEEADEYIGNRLMSDLAERLGTTVDDNTITYDNKVVNYYSETESFHVGEEEFHTVEEVFDYLTKDGESFEEED